MSGVEFAGRAKSAEVFRTLAKQAGQPFDEFVADAVRFGVPTAVRVAVGQAELRKRKAPSLMVELRRRKLELLAKRWGP